MRKRSNSIIFDEIRDRLERAIVYDGYILSLCPFHDDRHPSFFVYPDKYRCASCEAWGDTETLLDRIQGVFIPKDDFTYHNPFYEWANRFQSVLEAMIFAYKYGQEYSIYLDYLKDRGFTDQTIKKLKLGYLDGWITVPILRGKKFLGATARQIEGEARYMNPKGQDRDLLFIPDLEKVNKAHSIYVVFGIFDAVTLYQLGLPVITTLIGTTTKAELFEDYRKKIIIVPDQGEEKVGAELARKLDWRGKMLNLPYPLHTKDINDLLQRGHQEILDGLALT